MAVKKKYFDVDLELLETSIPLLAFEPTELENKTINLDLTKMLKGKNSQAKFKIKGDKEKLIGEIYSFRINPAYIQRIIGHNISIVEDSFLVKTKDCTVRVKPFLIARKSVHRSVRTELRNKTKEELTNYFANQDRKTIFESVLFSMIQKTLSKTLKKIYPLAVCEIRVLEVTK